MKMVEQIALFRSLFILLQILGGSADYILFGKKYEREIKITKEQKEVLINLINAFNE